MDRPLTADNCRNACSWFYGNWICVRIMTTPFYHPYQNNGIHAYTRTVSVVFVRATGR